MLPENNGGSYKHFDNCKQYWQCQGTMSSARCCPGLEHYNDTTGECTFDRDYPCFPEQCKSDLVPGNNAYQQSLIFNTHFTYLSFKVTRSVTMNIFEKKVLSF